MEARPVQGETKPLRQFDVREALRAIARPRLTGSEGAAHVTAGIRARFDALGYEVLVERFTFNPWPGRFGVTAAGVLYTFAVAGATLLIDRGMPFNAVVLLLLLLVMVGGLAVFAAPAIDRPTFARQEGANLLALIAGSSPKYVVMAHRDSKSQPLPLAFRGPAILFAVLTWLFLLIAALAETVQPVPRAMLLLIGVIAVAAGVTLSLCWVENRSDGALDNASGVVAALGIAANERDAGDVAFLITDAEELGLAGSRAAAPRLPPVFGVINLDGLDDDGPFYVLERFGVIRKIGLAPHLAAALLEEAAARGEPARRRDLPFGIPTDHVAMTNAGLPALTIMRGSLRSLARVHRPTDDLAHLSGTGIEKTIELVSGALRRLREQTRAITARH